MKRNSFKLIIKLSRFITVRNNLYYISWMQLNMFMGGISKFVILVTKSFSMISLSSFFRMRQRKSSIFFFFFLGKISIFVSFYFVSLTKKFYHKLLRLFLYCLYFSTIFTKLGHIAFTFYTLSWGKTVLKMSVKIVIV